jgi:hypothetical protein
MSRLVDEFQDNLIAVQQIIQELKLEDDVSLLKQITRIQIELDGVSVNHHTNDAATNRYLEQIHRSRMYEQLESLVRGVLGYYSLVAQPKGSNEPPIGPLYAQQLLSRMEDESINLMQIKDELHAHLTDADNSG